MNTLKLMKNTIKKFKEWFDIDHYLQKLKIYTCTLAFFSDSRKYQKMLQVFT